MTSVCYIKEDVMIKRITKIALCLVSFFGFTLIALQSVLCFPADKAFNEVTSAGLGVSADMSGYYNLPKQQQNYPYEYINLPKANELPLAFTIYNNIPPQETNQPNGQDSPETQPPSDTTPPNEPSVTLPNGVFPVIGLDMSENQTSNNLIFRNESKYSPDINLLAQSDYPLRYSKAVSSNSDKQPLVLIVHTHGTECYLPDSINTYTANTPTRSQDTSLNVVAVGKILAEELNKKGVPTLHCETMFDAQSYSDSYDLSEKQILEYLKRYPSIQYVFDVHRDSIIRENNEKIKPIVDIDGIPTAQAMFVVGTNSSGADHPGWLDNLTVASIFQSKLIKQYGNIMRPLNLRAASFNAEHAPGSILIEIGTCGNTITEAKNCAALLGSTIADIILNDGNT